MSLNFKTLIIIYTLFLAINNYAQQGHVEINQDKNIEALLKVKTAINKAEINPDRYKIQIFSGKSEDAYKAQKEFHELFNDWKSIDTYEEPNYKIWVGNFRTRLEADRALKKIKRKFPSAFIFKPKREKSG